MMDKFGKSEEQKQFFTSWNGLKIISDLATPHDKSIGSYG